MLFTCERRRRKRTLNFFSVVKKRGRRGRATTVSFSQRGHSFTPEGKRRGPICSVLKRERERASRTVSHIHLFLFPIPIYIFRSGIRLAAIPFFHPKGVKIFYMSNACYRRMPISSTVQWNCDRNFRLHSSAQN